MLASVACTHCAKKQNSELLSYKKIGKKGEIITESLTE